MDFNITLTAKNEVMDYVKTVLPIVGVLLGAALGFFFGYLLERVKRQRELRNIRSILLREMKWNCAMLMTVTPFDGPRKNQALKNVVAAILNILSFSVYEKYLDKLCGLKEEETKSVCETYLWTQYYTEQGREAAKGNISTGDAALDRDVDREDTDTLYSYCDLLLYRIAQTIELFEDGTEGLYDLMDKEKNKREQTIDSRDPDGHYRQWFNKYANKRHPFSYVAREDLGKKRLADIEAKKEIKPIEVNKDPIDDI